MNSDMGSISSCSKKIYFEAKRKRANVGRLCVKLEPTVSVNNCIKCDRRRRRNAYECTTFERNGWIIQNVGHWRNLFFSDVISGYTWCINWLIFVHWIVGESAVLLQQRQIDAKHDTLFFFVGELLQWSVRFRTGDGLDAKRPYLLPSYKPCGSRSLRTEGHHQFLRTVFKRKIKS